MYPKYTGMTFEDALKFVLFLKTPTFLDDVFYCRETAIFRFCRNIFCNILAINLKSPQVD